jgi:predicted RNA binding protein YcfA (HicA-like mRNA interferase family)
MTRRTLDRATTAREVCQALDHHPALREKRQRGSHVVYTGPGGNVIVPAHPGDLKRGTLKSICRMALLAGLSVLVLAAVLLMI